MITKFKIFETIHRYKPVTRLKKGNYAVALNTNLSDVDTISIREQKILENFIKNNVGEVLEVNSDEIQFSIKIQYIVDNIEILKLFNKAFSRGINNDNEVVVEFEEKEVSIWSDNKEELEIELETDKYNL